MSRRNWVVPALLGLPLCLAAQAQQPFSVHNDPLANPKYEIVFSESYISTKDAEAVVADFYESQRGQHESSRSEEPESNSKEDNDLELMMLGDQPYLCNIPIDSSQTNQNASSPSQDEQQQELARASNRGWELLKGMQGDCIYYGAGWWFYAFCFNKHIKQFHPLPPSREVPHYPPVEDETIGSYILGRFKSGEKKDANSNTKEIEGKDTELSESPAKEYGVEISPPQLQTRGETNFLVQWLEGGTVCDLTGRERRIEVQFHCNPGMPDHINLIKETASCVYLMIIHTPRLCDDVAFLPPQTVRPNSITCREIIDEHEVAEWKAAKTEQAKSLLSGLKEEAASLLMQGPRHVVGGIEVGAQKLVGGSPERKIRPSEAVQRAQRAAGNFGASSKDDDEDEVIAVLAKSDGQYTTTLNEKEMKKKDILSSKKDLDKLVNQMNEKAGNGQAWRLEVVKTADGFSYKGVLEDKSSPKGRDTPRDNEEGSEEKMKPKKDKPKD